MTDQRVLDRQLCNEIRLRYPDFQGRSADNPSKNARVLGPMEPCEVCGTKIVPLETKRGRGWWELSGAVRNPTGWSAYWREHKCRR